MSDRPLMECGCQAQAMANGFPTCVRHGVTTSIFWPNLESRTSRCSCGDERPSTEAIAGKLAFFEYRGPGTRWEEICVHCGRYCDVHPVKGLCREPTPQQGGRETDLFYCGHAGWD